MKLAVTIYRRPGGAPIYSGVSMDDAMLRAADLRHGLPAWGFAEPGIAVVCGPDWEAAVSKFLSEHRQGENVTATREGKGATRGEGKLSAPAAPRAPVKTDR